MRSPALGVHPALGNDLAIEVCELLDQPDVLEQGRTTTTGCQNVRVVRYGRTGCVCKALEFDIMNSLFQKCSSSMQSRSVGLNAAGVPLNSR